MATNNKIETFTSADIEKYHQGLLSSQQRHALEKAALDDPFLADALEGYALATINIKADLQDLQQKLDERTGETKNRRASAAGSFPWLRAAAVVILVAGAAYLSLQVFNNKKETENLAVTPPTAEQSNNPQAQVPILKDSSFENQVLNNGSASVRADTSFAETVTSPSVNNIPKGTLSDSISTPGKDMNYSIPNPRKADQVTITPLEVDKNAENNSAGYVKTEKLKEINSASMKRAGKAKVPERSNLFFGKVTDAENRGLPFANVTNVRDQVGTYTDVKGNFVLTSPDSILTVQVRSTGFEQTNIELQNRAATNQVILEEDRSIAAQTLSNSRVNTERRSRDSHFQIEGEPEPEDGWENYDYYLSNNINLADDIVKTRRNSGGSVELSFEVNRDGEPVNIKVEKSLCTQCDLEAIRLVKTGPKWKRKARKRTTVTISF